MWSKNLNLWNVSLLYFEALVMNLFLDIANTVWSSSQWTHQVWSLSEPSQCLDRMVRSCLSLHLHVSLIFSYNSHFPFAPNMTNELSHPTDTAFPCFCAQMHSMEAIMKCTLRTCVSLCPTLFWVRGLILMLCPNFHSSSHNVCLRHMQHPAKHKNIFFLIIPLLCLDNKGITGKTVLCKRSLGQWGFMVPLSVMSLGACVSRRRTGVWDCPGSSGAGQAAPLHAGGWSGRVCTGAALPAGCIQADIWQEAVPTCKYTLKSFLELKIQDCCWHLVDGFVDAACVNCSFFFLLYLQMPVGSRCSLDSRVPSYDRTDPPADPTGSSCPG